MILEFSLGIKNNNVILFFLSRWHKNISARAVPLDTMSLYFLNIEHQIKNIFIKKKYLRLETMIIIEKLTWFIDEHFTKQNMKTKQNTHKFYSCRSTNDKCTKIKMVAQLFNLRSWCSQILNTMVQILTNKNRTLMYYTCKTQAKKIFLKRSLKKIPVTKCQDLALQNCSEEYGILYLSFIPFCTL